MCGVSSATTCLTKSLGTLSPLNLDAIRPSKYPSFSISLIILSTSASNKNLPTPFSLKLSPSSDSLPSLSTACLENVMLSSSIVKSCLLTNSCISFLYIPFLESATIASKKALVSAPVSKFTFLNSVSVLNKLEIN